MVVLKFLFALLMPLVHGNINTTLIRDRIPDLAKIYCPGRNVCANRTSTQHVQPADDVCCTDCSCEPLCSLEGTCCYKDTINELKESNDARGNQDKLSECLFPIIPEPRNRERIRNLSFKMIAKISKDKMCGKRKVAPWGSLHPVTSKLSGHIYKNIKCAENNENHNITDADAFEIWKAYLICTRNDVTRNILGLVNGSFDEDCELRFIPPRDKPVSQSDVCYRDIINTCPNKTFSIPNGMVETRKEIIAACHSGLVSPFRKNDMYANVFCYICNRNTLRKHDTCKTLSPLEIRSGFGDTGYIGLLDATFLQNAMEKRRYGVQNSETVCLDTGREKRDETCRPVLCPSGQLRDTTGKCKYPLEEWIVPGVTVLLKLTSEIPFAIEQIHGTLSGLRSPWPKQWFIESIFTEVTRNSLQSNVIVVRISNAEPQRNPYRLLRVVQISMSRQWILSMNNKTYEFVADFFYTTLLKADKLYWSPLYHIHNILENVTVQEFILLYRNKPKRDGRDNRLRITKLYFCKQVKLFSSEFLSVKGAMYNNISNRYLLNNEFILLDSEGQTVAQVCLEDSGFAEALVDAAGNMASVKVGSMLLTTLAFSIL